MDPEAVIDLTAPDDDNNDDHREEEESKNDSAGEKDDVHNANTVPTRLRRRRRLNRPDFYRPPVPPASTSNAEDSRTGRRGGANARNASATSSATTSSAATSTASNADFDADADVAAKKTNGHKKQGMDAAGNDKNKRNKRFRITDLLAIRLQNNNYNMELTETSTTEDVLDSPQPPTSPFASSTLTVRTEQQRRNHPGVDRDEVCNDKNHGWDDGSGDGNDNEKFSDGDNSKSNPKSGVSKSHNKQSRKRNKPDADIEFNLDNVETGDTKGGADPPSASKNISGSSDDEDLSSDDESYSSSGSSVKRDALNKPKIAKPLAINVQTPESQRKRIRQNSPNNDQSLDPHIGRESVIKTIVLSEATLDAEIRDELESPKRQPRQRNPPNYYQPPGNPNSDNFEQDDDQCSDDGSMSISANNGEHNIHTPKLKLNSSRARRNDSWHSRRRNKYNILDSLELDFESSDEVESTVSKPTSAAGSRRNRTPTNRYHPEMSPALASARKRTSSNPTESESESKSESSCLEPNPKVKDRQLPDSSIRFSNSNVESKRQGKNRNAKQQNQNAEGDSTVIGKRTKLKCPANVTSCDDDKSDVNDVCKNKISKPKKGKKDEYYEIDQILDRRVKRGSRGSSIVEYKVSWKQDFEPEWLVAENLDQNSLAEAFRKFPVDDDINDRLTYSMQASEVIRPHRNPDMDALDEAFNNITQFDDSDPDENVEDVISLNSLNSEGEDSSDDDSERSNDSTPDPTLKEEVSHLRDSDYNAPGTVELYVHRKSYRVGQSFYDRNWKPIEGNIKYIYTVSIIRPKTEQAVCLQFMRMENSFVCPKGMEGEYIQMRDEVVMDLAALVPCKQIMTKSSFIYEEGENQRSFSYSTNRGEIKHHPWGRPATMDLYAGVGGMSLGLKNAGFDVKWIVENNELAAATYKANTTNPDVEIYTASVRSFLKQCIEGNPSCPKVGDPEHIHGSPPCNGFSRANRNGGKNDAENNYQTLLFIEAIRHFRPPTVTMENVPTLISIHKPYLQWVASELLMMSYQVRVAILDSRHYGDPQKRKRLILWAARKDCILPSLPAPTHGPELLPFKTAKNALETIERFPPAKPNRMSVIRLHGKNIYNHITQPSKLEISDADHMLCEDEPSRTIIGSGSRSLHYNGKRVLSVREVACLQSFPLTFRFFGPVSAQYRQVGNAVPICLATAVARSVAVVHGCPP